MLALATLTSCSLTTFGQTNGGNHPISQTQVSLVYTADPSTHDLNGKIGYPLGRSATVGARCHL